MKLVWLAPLLLVACGGKGSKDGREICERAGEKYATCVREILGAEMEKMVRQNAGVAQCAADEKTVEMYRTCLPKTDCNAFLECAEDFARGQAPPIAADKPRREQCQQHVKDGLRAIANGIVVMGEHAKRSDSAKRRAQSCTMDESAPWTECIEPAERTEVERYAKHRQVQCEAWSDELAACILRLPGAHDCKPDEFPLWDVPLEVGGKGPAIAWSIDVADDDDYTNDVHFEWAANQTLIVRDDGGLRALRGGTERWKAPGVAADFVLVGSSIVARGVAGGVRVFDVATGPRGAALEGVSVERLGLAGDRVLAQVADRLHAITPAQCTGKRTCAKQLAELESEDAQATSIGAWRDGVVMASTSGVRVIDQAGKPRLAITLDANSVQLTKDSLIVADDKGVAVLSLAECSKLGRAVYLPSTTYRGETIDLSEDCADCELPRGECISSQLAVSWVSSVEPAALAGGAIAFNDHGIRESTQLFGPTAKWKTETNGRGGVAGDDKHVYTVSFGSDGKGPVQLLALARDTGRIEWHTALGAASATSTEIQLAVRDGLLAVRIGGKLFVIELARKA